ncbi:MAG: hypothetical protein EBU73_02980 [Chitinophagia bacterium]|nr:hypothetical protein [Chitinophagia bacterium]
MIDCIVFEVWIFLFHIQKIFNRWGQLIYTNNNYNNDWDGRATSTNQYLPSGSYFYQVELLNKTTGLKTVRRGPLLLKRDN